MFLKIVEYPPKRSRHFEFSLRVKRAGRKMFQSGKFVCNLDRTWNLAFQYDEL